MPAIPNHALCEKTIFLGGDSCFRVNSPPSCRTVRSCHRIDACDEISSFVAHQTELGHGRLQIFS